MEPFRGTVRGTGRAKKLEAVVWGSGHPVHMVNTCQWSADKEPYIHIPVGPKRISLEFLIDTGTQISVLNEQQASELGIRPSRKAINIRGVIGATEKCPITWTQLWLPGEKRMTAVEVALSPYEGNILGFDVLAGKQWDLPNGSVRNALTLNFMNFTSLL